MATPVCGYLEHVAVRVRDIHWHIRFFETVFGWQVRQTEGDPVHPLQVWIGGIQLVADPAFDGIQGRVHHLGIRCESVDRAMTIAYAIDGVTHLERGRQWLVLPEGLIVELLPASNTAVTTALSVHPTL